MGYQWTSRIGFHEVDRELKLALPDLIDYFQDSGGFHGADCGFSTQKMIDMGIAWIISSWQVHVTKLPVLDDPVVIETYPVQFKYCMAYRHYIMRSPDGQEFAKANSIWLLMNMKKYAPVKIPSELREAYGACDDQTGGFSFGGRKIDIPTEGTVSEAIRASKYMIDANGHVNNKEYIRIAGALLPEDTRWNFFRTEYTSQAKEGDLMIPVISREENRTCVTLNNKEGAPYFIGEWSKR